MTGALGQALDPAYVRSMKRMGSMVVEHCGSRVVRAVTLAIALGAGACAAPVTPAGGSRVAESYTVAGGQFTSGGGLYLAIEAREIDGRVGLCGAWTRSRQSALSRRHNDDVLSSGSVTLGGALLVQNLTFLRRHPIGTSLLGQQAQCVITGTPWQAGAETQTLRVHLPPRVFERDLGERGAKGGTRFRQTEVSRETVL